MISIITDDILIACKRCFEKPSYFLSVQILQRISRLLYQCEVTNLHHFFVRIFWRAIRTHWQLRLSWTQTPFGLKTSLHIAVINHFILLCDQEHQARWKVTIVLLELSCVSEFNRRYFGGYYHHDSFWFWYKFLVLIWHFIVILLGKIPKFDTFLSYRTNLWLRKYFYNFTCSIWKGKLTEHYANFVLAGIPPNVISAKTRRFSFERYLTYAFVTRLLFGICVSTGVIAFLHWATYIVMLLIISSGEIN